MNPTELATEVALAKLDQEDAGKEGDPKEEDKQEVKEEVKDDKAEADKDAKEDKADPKEEEGKYTADDALEVDSPVIAEQPMVDAAGIHLSPAEQKYIAEHLSEIGDAVTFTGKQGDKEVSFKVYDFGQLPSDFQPDSIVAFNQGMRQLQAMDKRGMELLGGFRNQQSATQAREFEQRENESIRNDVAELQKDGAFPKFKVQPGARGFNDDPGAQQMAEVLKLMTSRNDQYVAEYNQGRQYRHIGFREAFEIWERQQPAKQKAEAQKSEDKERKQVADKVGTSRGATSEGLQKPRVPRGTTMQDIINRYDYELN